MEEELSEFDPNYVLAKLFNRHSAANQKNISQKRTDLMTYAVLDTIEKFSDYFAVEADAKKIKKMARDIASNLVKKIQESIPQ